MYNYLDNIKIDRIFKYILFLPIILNIKPPILAKIVSVVKSPSDAAIGVAILSGLILHL
jgi:hypothetical protein